MPAEDTVYEGYHCSLRLMRLIVFSFHHFEDLPIWLQYHDSCIDAICNGDVIHLVGFMAYAKLPCSSGVFKPHSH